MTTERRELDFAAALLDPAAAYLTPQQVVEDARLTREQKIEVLRRWEYDEAERRVAEEEGMPAGRAGDEGDLLRQIVLALDALSDGVDLDRTPPTKQGGIPRRTRS
ncbi:MAG TPA: hypothetical protein VK862_14535 [Afifellaceae bacterium]|nr:hypothetical protein [Afifellaceae bacterium]